MHGYRVLTRTISVGLVLLGLAILLRTWQLGGGQVGYALGALFVAAGLGRLYLSR
jgi:hypothetical protein